LQHEQFHRRRQRSPWRGAPRRRGPVPLAATAGTKLNAPRKSRQVERVQAREALELVLAVEARFATQHRNADRGRRAMTCAKRAGLDLTPRRAGSTP